MNDVLLLEKDDATAVIRLNRPRVHNVVDEHVMTRLESTLDKIERDAGVRTIILTASGDESFCAGGDLRYFAKLKTREQGLEMSRRMQAILNRMWNGSRPVIAAVQGRALGGGCEMLTAGHYRIASETASFAFRQAANGITTGWGGGARLFRQIGRSRAWRLLLTAETIDAREALRIGLVDLVIPPAELMDAALKLAARINRMPPEVVRAFLELGRRTEAEPPEDVEKWETETFGDFWTGKDFREALGRFLNE